MPLIRIGHSAFSMRIRQRFEEDIEAREIVALSGSTLPSESELSLVLSGSCCSSICDVLLYFQCQVKTHIQGLPSNFACP